MIIFASQVSSVLSSSVLFVCLFAEVVWSKSQTLHLFIHKILVCITNKKGMLKNLTMLFWQSTQLTENFNILYYSCSEFLDCIQDFMIKKIKIQKRFIYCICLLYLLFLLLCNNSSPVFSMLQICWRNTIICSVDYPIFWIWLIASSWYLI